ncbi:MAG: hypothetical protein FD143_3205 [Ignavibacteria bacterium]|nr:MAG: hypothetical protein FD143_3205 [Ignavibacteria bacterium]KAF0153940.1 MAG: hypothetical protein FD188_3319 [Ignavibacteria bacterium]
MKQKVFRIMKTAVIGMFAFLIFFNISVIVDEEGFAVKMVNSIFAEEWCADCPENGGTGGSGGTSGSSKNTYFANYGTQTRKVWCQRVGLGFPSGLTVSGEWKTDSWDQYWCVRGGSNIACTLGTGQIRNFVAGCNS